MPRWRDPWPLPPEHKPTGWCVLPGHGPEPWLMTELLAFSEPTTARGLVVCPMHDGDAADGKLTSPAYNRPMCGNSTCRLRAGHEGDHVPLAREMRR